MASQPEILRERAWWREQDSNLRRRTSADLQSAAFDRSAIPPHQHFKRVIRDLAASVNEEVQNIRRGLKMVVSHHHYTFNIVKLRRKPPLSAMRDR